MLKKGVVSLFILFGCTNAFTQTVTYKHPSTLGIHFNLLDFKNSTPFGNLANTDAGLSINYLHGVNSRIDYAISIGGAFADSVSKAYPKTVTKKTILQTDFSVRARFFNKPKAVQPYWLTGFGLSAWQSKVGSYLTFGPGVQTMYKDIYLQTSFQYRASLSSNVNNHFLYSIGIAGLIGQKSVVKKMNLVPNLPPVVVTDKDGDGIVDAADACPATPGLAAYNGCPDSDGDGVEDRKDKCPAIFGYEKYAGCPIPDSDGDGINNEEDQCPNVPGVLRFHGCPIPDTDGDGVNDLEDSCLSVPGAKETNGCPLVTTTIEEKINRDAKNIFFKNGSYKLDEKSFESLNEVVYLLQQNPHFHLSVEGHTDNRGGEGANKVLSENRAKTVAGYLITHGIERLRISFTGYGQLRPVATNKTEEGRLKNRRVEFRLIRNN